MRDSMKKVQELLKARIQCIWIQTYEEAEVVKDLTAITNEMPGAEMFLWSHTEGCGKVPLNRHDVQKPFDATLAQPANLFKFIGNRQREDKENVPTALYVMRDLHHLLEHHAVNRGLRDIKEYQSRNYTPIIVVSPVVAIPAEVEKLFTVIEYDLPSRAEITELVNDMDKKLRAGASKGKDFTAPTAEEKEVLIKACLGLTLKEIIDVFAKSIIKYKKLSVEAISEEKIQLVKKSGVLDYSIPSVSFDDIGGNHVYKEWIDEVQESFSEQAREFGVKLPKGALHVGVAGTSKTLMAEALASKMRVPLIKLQMSKVMDRLVGNSEKKMDQAMRVVKAISPCVLLVDEIEKALGGISSSSQTDGGTLARVFASLLNFMHSNDSGVFVVMTSNDVSAIPPELTRAGRLDAHWFFTLPTQEEREEIFKIHFRKVGRSLSDEAIQTVAKAAEHYTGAEIEEVVKVSMRKAYKRFKEDGNNEILTSDIEPAIEEVIPLYKSSREKIAALDAWSQGRARRTNREEKFRSGYDEAVDSSLMSDLHSLL